MRIPTLLVAALLPSLALAQSQGVTDCTGDGPAHLTTLIEPIEDNTRTFANGAIRFLVLDFAEPACCWAHIAVLHPPAKGSEEDNLGLRQCTLVSLDDGFTGFDGVRLSQTTASYDPAKGLSVTVPVGAWSPVEGTYDAEVTITVNQATGSVTVN